MILRGLLFFCISITVASCAEIDTNTSPIIEITDQTNNFSPPQTEKDLTKLTITELNKLIAAGDTKAKAQLGARYGLGEGVEQDLERAIEILTEAAEDGEPEAEFFLGTAYYSGLGVPHSEMGAVVWFEKAASKGHAAAQYWLAVLIKEGRGGISPSWGGAVPLLWKSAMQGYGAAQFLLGYAYQTGSGIEKNSDAAAYWYRRNLNLGWDSRTVFNLALMIKEGEVEWQPGDPQDLKPPHIKSR